MALAYLMKVAADHGVAHKDSLRAFIVDHKARNESSEEAQTVKQNLKNLGIHTEILEIEWGRKVPKSNFEHLAREHRYQLLARACIKDNIWDLMTAHHANDQAETIFMRLISRSGWSGLAGMSPIALVPECENIYNASKLRLIRPFLSFWKTRLRDTCIENNIPWVEDATNHDPTSSKRNAIRHIFKHQADSLPKALQPPALIAMGDRIRNRIAEEEAIADSIIPKFHANLNPKTFVLELHYSRQLLYEYDPIIIGRAIKKLIEPISPMGVEGIPMYKLRNSLSILFPPLLLQRSIERGSDQQVPKATSCNLVWETEVLTGEKNRAWGDLYCRISRQPWRKSERPLVKHLIPPSKDWSEPILWDGRFWISVRNPNNTVVVKNWWPSDDSKVLKNPKYKELVTRFDRIPGSVKTSLPVIKVAGQKGQEGGDILVAAPTVKFMVKEGGVEVRCKSRSGITYM
ncbi:hypothetical protein BJ508DRAFT_306829 [Ascobolus immersus RN42]|uniref:tRNA(Ile)-lysidine synthetase n=1 Tax=Ascobolus immersus RN42 TaxID=1160509 RepID=A0A3N4IA87_ASCIM|nr:hypothetical protein BJ508DRAFT_306829 [Ascobolus immersus RN42]